MAAGYTNTLRDHGASPAGSRGEPFRWRPGDAGPVCLAPLVSPDSRAPGVGGPEAAPRDHAALWWLRAPIPCVITSPAFRRTRAGAIWPRWSRLASGAPGASPPQAAAVIAQGNGCRVHQYPAGSRRMPFGEVTKGRPG